MAAYIFKAEIPEACELHTGTDLWGATIEKTTYMIQVMHTSHLDRFDEICLVRIVKLAVHTLRLSRYNNNFVMYSIDSFRKSLRKKKNVFLFHCIVINFPRRWPAEVVAKRKNTYAFVECSDKYYSITYRYVFNQKTKTWILWKWTKFIFNLPCFPCAAIFLFEQINFLIISVTSMNLS